MCECKSDHSVKMSLSIYRLPYPTTIYLHLCLGDWHSLVQVDKNVFAYVQRRRKTNSEIQADMVSQLQVDFV